MKKPKQPTTAQGIPDTAAFIGFLHIWDNKAVFQNRHNYKVNFIGFSKEEGYFTGNGVTNELFIRERNAPRLPESPLSLLTFETIFNPCSQKIYI